MTYKVTINNEPLYPRVAAAAQRNQDIHSNPNKRRTLVAPHSIERQGDENYCARCNRRWEANENPPSACAPKPSFVSMKHSGRWR